MKLSLEPRLQQILAPQLIQSLRLLQMPTLRLEQYIQAELSQNPLLEVEEEEQPPDEGPTEKPDAQPGDLRDMVETGKTDGRLTDEEWDYLLGDDYEAAHKVRGEREEIDDDREPSQTYAATLSDHLYSQLHLVRGISDEERLAGETLIGEIDGRGYLPDSLDALSAVTGHPVPLLAKMLDVIHGFDPPGVGARDLKESLLLQLKHAGEDDTLAAELVAGHLDELGSKSVAQLAEAVNAEPADVAEAVERIRQLSPHPASGKFATPSRYVTPDLAVIEEDGEYVVRTNDGSLPSLRVSPVYREVLRRGSLSTEAEKQFVRDKLEQARWLIGAIAQRRSTMTRVMEAIVDAQRGFFVDGPEHLRPLTMESIAERVGVNVSTVSRVASEKYVQTPYGICSLRDFFTGGYTTRGKSGATEEVSADQVKHRVREIIEAEDRTRPLSDQAIARRLAEDGIPIARRTVAKYRDEMYIKSARMRRTA